MSQFILDDLLDVHEVLSPIRKRWTARLLRELRPYEHILDDRVPEILLTLKRPTFVTMDRGFWEEKLCHRDYCILVFDVLPRQQELIPSLLRALLRRPEFQTRAVRLGKVALVSRISIKYWQHLSQTVHSIEWPAGFRRKRS